MQNKGRSAAVNGVQTGLLRSHLTVSRTLGQYILFSLYLSGQLYGKQTKRQICAQQLNWRCMNEAVIANQIKRRKKLLFLCFYLGNCVRDF